MVGNLAGLLFPSLAAANEATGEGPSSGPAIVRLVQSPGAFEPQTLELHPGRHIFMVTNRGVEHQVDFMLKRVEARDAQGKADPRPVRGARLVRPVPNGATSSTPVVALKPGIHVYESPLNKTPQHTLTVR